MSRSSNTYNDDDDDDSNLPFESSGDELSSIGTGIILFASACAILLLRILQLVAVIFSWLWFLVTVTPYLAVGIGITFVMIPYVYNQDTIMEEVDFFMRCRFEPFYNTWPRQLITIVQMVFNPLICYYDATFWLPFGILQEVVIPLLIDCGIAQTALSFLNFILVFLVDFLVGYIASFQFLTGDFDYVPSGVAWNAAWTSWQATLTCVCSDLSVFVKAAWIITAFPPVIPLPVQIFIGFPTHVIATVPRIATVFSGPLLGLIGGNQVGDPQSWCAVWSAFNGAMNVIQQLLRIIAAILTGQFSNFPRPDFTHAVDNFCQSISCLMRSIENVNQFLFDNFIPFPFLDWHNFLCIYDSFICLIFRAVSNILLILVNIDQIIQYPTNPFYETQVVPKVIQWINLIAPPRYKSPIGYGSQYPVQYESWLWPTNSSLIPGTLTPNPVYNVNRFSDCICIYFKRLICDPSDPSTPCYQQSVQTILGPFDPCCIFKEALTIVADNVAALFDITRHLYSFDALTIWVNNQYITTAMAEDLTALVACLFNAFSIIPTVGPCLAQFFTGVAAYAFSLIDFLLRIVNGLIFLPYYLINNIQNFITNRGQALQFLLTITNTLTNATLPNSSINCACFVLNFGIPIPPIPCSSCVPGGYIQPTLDKRRFPTTFKLLDELNQRLESSSSNSKGTSSGSEDSSGSKGISKNPEGPLGTSSGSEGSFGTSKNNVPSESKGTPGILETPKRLLKNMRETSMPEETGADLRRKLDARHAAMRKAISDKINAYRRNEWPESMRPYHTWNRNPVDSQWNMKGTSEEQEEEDSSKNSGFNETTLGTAPPVMRRSDATGQFTLSPTAPPVAPSCTDPVPQCFDLCCNLRSTANLLYQLTFFLGQTINSLAQDWDIGFPYFVTGDVSICSAQCPTQQTNVTNCATPCPGLKITFEQSLVNLIVAATQVLVCGCNVFNLVIPITGYPSIYTERPDVCCWVVRTGDFIAASLLVLIRMIKELAQGNVSPPGTPPYPYFTQGQFIADVDQLFAIQLDIVVCLGFLVRSIFPIQTVADLDVYCPVENLAIFLISLQMWNINTIISLGTIQYTVGQNYFIDPNCNWEATGCVPLVTDLQFYREGAAVIDAFFGTSGGACSSNIVGGPCSNPHGTDLGIGGLTECICQVVSTIFPIRPNPGAPTGPPNNCPIVDVCCPLRQFAFYQDGLQKFLLQGLTTVWQRWDGAFPSAFFAFFFCDENASPTPEGCGILNPVIDQFTDIISLCICQIFQLLDAFLANFFPGFRCFCGSGFPEGIFCSLGDLIRIILVQFWTMVRRSNDISYWQPAGYPAPDLSQTWAVRFFAPMQQGLCSFVGSHACFITTLIPFCPNWTTRWLQAGFIWTFESIIRLAEFIEGFVSTFVGAPCATSANTGSAYGINLSCLSGAIISLISFPWDLLFADGMLACRQRVCECYDGQFVGTNYSFAEAISGNVYGQDGRVPQQCVRTDQTFVDQPWWFQTCCNGTAATFTLPSGLTKVCLAYNSSMPATAPECLGRCTGTVPTPCHVVVPVLPLCNSVVGFLPMDGILMAPLRLLRCLFQLGFGGGAIIDAPITLISVIWQLSKPILNLWVNTLMFLFGFIINPPSIFDFPGRIIGFFSSFTAIFSGAIILPGNVDPFARRFGRFGNSSSGSFGTQGNSRGASGSGPKGFGTARNHVQSGGVLQALKVVFMDYRTDDCHETDGFTTCINRNFYSNCSTLACAVDVVKHRFSLNATGHEQEMTVGPEPDPESNPQTSVALKSACSVLVQASDDTLSFPLAERLMYVDCIEKRIMGERLRDYIFPHFPPAAFYVGWWYLPALVEEVDDHFRAIQQGRPPRHDERFAMFERELHDRAVNLRESGKFTGQMLRLVTRLDALEYKFRSGYFGYMFKRARDRRNAPSGARTPGGAAPEGAPDAFDIPELYFTNYARLAYGSVSEAATISISNLIPLVTSLSNSFFAATEVISDTYTLRLRLGEFATRWWDLVTREDPVDRVRRERIRNYFKAGPIYQWFAGTGSSSSSSSGSSAAGAQKTVEGRKYHYHQPIVHWQLGEFIRHLYNVSQTYKQSTEPGFWNAYGLGERYNATKDHLSNRFLTAHWTPLQRENYEMAKRVTYRIYDTLYPGHLSAKEHERFILDDGCPIINDSFNLIVSSYSYCANLASRNADRTISNVTNEIREAVLGPRFAKLMGRVLNFTESVGRHSLRSCRTCMGTQKSSTTALLEDSSQKKKRDSWFDFNYRDAAQDLYPRYAEESVWPPLKGNVRNERFGWVRPRNVQPMKPLPPHLNVSYVGYYQYRRATHNPRDDASMFNLYEWLVSIIDTITGWGILPWLKQGFINAQQFVLNPNYRCEDYPDVGLKYYVVFELQCSFPCNVDCRNGIGLEAALGQIFLYYGLAFLVCLFVFQSGLSFIISTLVLFIVFVMVLSGIAWGFSIRCLFLSPAFAVNGFQVWWFPFPFVSIYPLCIIDDLVALLDKWINSCYDFVWPTYFLCSAACPACPARICVPNCLRDYRIGDGLSNWLYIGYWLAGNDFCSIVQAIGQVFAIFIPGIPSYLSAQCTNFAQSNAEALQFCFWATLPSLVLPLALGAIGATFIGFVFPSFVSVLVALWGVIITSPLGILWGAAQNSFQPSMDDPDSSDSSDFSEGGGDDDDDDNDFPSAYSTSSSGQGKKEGTFFAGVRMISASIQSAIHTYRVVPAVQKLKSE